MAKLASTFGAISGRVGGNVFSKGENGRVIIRAYQPQINNPKSAAQTDQRQKVVLTGKLSSLVPATILTNLGGTKRQRRAAFLKNLIENTTINREMQRDEVIALLPPEKIVFSKGTEQPQAGFGKTINRNKTVVTLTLINGEYAGRYGERIILLAMDKEDLNSISFIMHQEVILDDTTPVELTFNYNARPEDSTIIIYRVPFMLNEAGVSARSTDIYSDNDDIISVLLQNPQNVRDYGASFMQSKDAIVAEG